MIVCLDSGNTRIKWGVHDGERWLAQGAVDHAGSGELAALPTTWPQPDKVLLANVAGNDVATRIREQLADWQSVFREVKAEAKRGGVTNRYQNPGQLGVDRWCALIGARSLTRMACIVVMAGTATTIDTLDADGNFLGGLILPGSPLMRRALARDTAGLPLAAGQYAEYPRCTDDAIVSGAIEAQAGAIERAFRRLADRRTQCLISGGDAQVLADCLSIPHALIPNLPLEGLKVLGCDD
ncbi:type III pantothenate kinase [Dechloromonas sp. A34]|uniref:type III pantothenate kinase n=1 Tax=Dechloromonas sp. A34 TaxID=447588 RepID=UPI002248D99B|nr:type III pantothenate kinase [Dechloromonas sp. A34]